MGQDILYIKSILYFFLTEQRATALASVPRLTRCAWCGGVTRPEGLGLASTLRVVAVAVVARLSDAHGGCGSARTMRVQREVQLALRNNYYISRAPQILFI